MPSNSWMAWFSRQGGRKSKSQPVVPVLPALACWRQANYLQTGKHPLTTQKDRGKKKQKGSHQRQHEGSGRATTRTKILALWFSVELTWQLTFSDLKTSRVKAIYWSYTECLMQMFGILKIVPPDTLHTSLFATSIIYCHLDTPQVL